MKYVMIIVIGIVWMFTLPRKVEAKSYVRSYMRGTSSVRSYIRYKADGYKFNNYQYRLDRGYRR